MPYTATATDARPFWCEHDDDGDRDDRDTTGNGVRYASQLRDDELVRGLLAHATALPLRLVFASAKLKVLIAQTLGTRCPLGTELDGADQLQWPPGDVLPVPEGQPVTPHGRAAQDTREGVQAARVDELESGEIDDDRRRADRSWIELAVENRSCYSVKRATEPDDQRLASASPDNHELALRGRLASVTNRGRDAPEAPGVGLQTGPRERCSR